MWIRLITSLWLPWMKILFFCCFFQRLFISNTLTGYQSCWAVSEYSWKLACYSPHCHIFELHWHRHIKGILFSRAKCFLVWGREGRRLADDISNVFWAQGDTRACWEERDLRIDWQRPRCAPSSPRQIQHVSMSEATLRDAICQSPGAWHELFTTLP